MDEAWKTALSWLAPPAGEKIRCASPSPETWTELRLRAEGAASVTADTEKRNHTVPGLSLSGDDLRAVLARACEGSVHAYDEEIRRGYLSVCGGIRIGICGRALCEGGTILRLREITSLCIRLPHKINVRDRDAERIVFGEDVRDTGPFPEDTHRILPTLFYGMPGCGKTTLLRYLIGKLSERMRCAVVDTGGEIGNPGGMTDVFSSYPRVWGIGLAVRAFSPEVLFCDEIGTEEEAREILSAQAGGVPMIATAHADSLPSLLARPAFENLYRSAVFSQYIKIGRKPGGFFFRREDVRP